MSIAKLMQNRISWCRHVIEEFGKGVYKLLVRIVELLLAGLGVSHRIGAR
jgi:hypothetical protein